MSKKSTFFLILAIFLLIITGCEYNSKYENPKYEIPDEDAFGHSLEWYINNGEFNINDYSYDLLEQYQEELLECYKEKIDSKFINSYVKEIIQNNYDEDELYDLLKDYKDMIAISVEKECSIKKWEKGIK